MKILVCGGRNYDNAQELRQVLDIIHKNETITQIIHGDARGADKLAKLWAIYREIEQIPFPADWNKHGRAAGPIRNRLMFDTALPDMVVAFEGGRGTADMVDYAIRKNCKVLKILGVVDGEIKFQKTIFD